MYKYIFEDIEAGFSDLFYKGKLKSKINFWVRIKGKDYNFSIDSTLLNDYHATMKSVKHQIISKLDLNNLTHIRFKQYLLSL